MAKILVVDDDRTLSGMIVSWLKFENHKIDLAGTVVDAMHFLDQYEYDVVILDWQLPDGSGLELLNEFRRRGGKTPVLMLTGRSKLEHKEAGFDAGADDYLTKPFHIKELAMRVKALLKRSPELKEEVLHVGDIVLDTKKREVTVCGESVELFPQEFDLLEVLMRHPDQVVRYEIVINHVWQSDAGVSPEALRTLIARLRKKLNVGGTASMIETVHGVGHKLRP